jgi:predicted PurR-regulated permease PerM
MMAEPESPVSPGLQRSRDAWRRLGYQILSITPQQLARMFLGLVALFAAGWVVSASWPALAPFLVGGIIAYTVLPLVDFLDRFMPRLLAAFLGVLAAVGVLAGLAAIIVPPLVQQVVRLIRDLPDAAEIAVIVTNLSQGPRLQQLPPLIQEQLLDTVSTVLLRMRSVADGIVPSLLGASPVAGLINTFSTVLGLLVLPTWALALLKDQPRAWPNAAQSLPPAVRPDVRALIRIVDNAFGTFLRSQVLLAIAVGVATYLGFALLKSASGLEVGTYDLFFAVLSGLLQLIPGVGPVVNTIGVTALAYFTRGQAEALQVLALYLAIQFVVGKFVNGRTEARLLDTHPVILILVIVALSQLGALWFFLAAPIASVARDLWRYLFGRLGEPAMPAGLLPSERKTYTQKLAEQQAAVSRPLPAVYRRR